MNQIRCHYDGPLMHFAELLASRLGTSVDFRDYENEWEWVWVHYADGFIDISRNHDDMQGGFQNPIGIFLARADREVFLDWAPDDARHVAKQIDGAADLVAVVDGEEVVLMKLTSDGKPGA